MRDGHQPLHGGELQQLQQGLRMAHPPDPEALRREAAALDALAQQPLPTRLGGYLRLIGPGYLQSAMTLGAGTASSSLFAGAVFGYELLWVAPVAMLLGIVMLMALAHQTLSTGLRPLPAMARFAGRPIAIGFAGGALLASIVWHFPQYNLAAGSLVDLADAAGVPGVPKMVASTLVLLAAVAMSFGYGRSAARVKQYERMLKWLVWAVVACLLWVVARTDTDWPAVWRGFTGFSLPSPRHGVSATALVVSALMAAVGINMVLLYPYSLLARGWGRSHRALARFDLLVGMLLPYALATSLMLIAAANTLHRSGATVDQHLSVLQAGAVLGHTLGPIAGRLVFDLGMLAMAFSTISLHMLVCGFVACEWFGCAVGSRAHRLWSLLPAPAFVAPWFWGDMAVWLAVPTTIACGALLPIAYVGILRLQRSRAYLGRDRPSGLGGALWFAAMLLATAILIAALVFYLLSKAA